MAKKRPATTMRDGRLTSMSTASARGQAAIATNNCGVLEAQVRAFSVRNCVEPGINSRLKSREPVLARHSDMQMGMERPEPVLGHQDLHLADGQVLDVLVLRPGVLDVGFTAESNRFVLVFKHPGALDSQGAPLLRNARRCFQEILRRLLVLGAQ